MARFQLLKPCGERNVFRPSQLNLLKLPEKGMGMPLLYAKDAKAVMAISPQGQGEEG